jgi:hypothetical protein
MTYAARAAIAAAIIGGSFLNRKFFGLVALLALVAACSSPASTESVAANPSTAASAAASTVASTPEPEASQAADPGSDTPLADLLPDQIGGESHTDIDFSNNPAFTGALAGSGTDIGDVEYIIRTWGSGDVVLNAMRVPGLTEAELETLARVLGGAGQTGGTAETVNVGGKEVLRIATTDVEDSAAYMYFAEGVWFTVVSESEDLAAEVLSALP